MIIYATTICIILCVHHVGNISFSPSMYITIMYYRLISNWILFLCPNYEIIYLALFNFSLINAIHGLTSLRMIALSDQIDGLIHNILQSPYIFPSCNKVVHRSCNNSIHKPCNSSFVTNSTIVNVSSLSHFRLGHLSNKIMSSMFHL